MRHRIPIYPSAQLVGAAYADRARLDQELDQALDSVRSTRDLLPLAQVIEASWRWGRGNQVIVVAVDAPMSATRRPAPATRVNLTVWRQRGWPMVRPVR